MLIEGQIVGGVAQCIGLAGAVTELPVTPQRMKLILTQKCKSASAA
jgi:hypothetical protein